MDSIWRVFIAIELPDALKQMLHKQVEGYVHSSSATFRKWAAWQDYHITIQFLGDVEMERIPDISALMTEAGADCVPFELQLGGWGTFGRHDSPRVLWKGVEGDIVSLRDTVDTVAGKLGLAGYVQEIRPYSPHVTVARQFQGNAPFILPLQQSNDIGSSWSVDRIVLYRTHMYKRPMYEAVHVAEFRN